MILALAIILCVNDYFALKVHISVCILYCLGFNILIYIFDRNKNHPFRYIVLLGLIASLGLLFLISRTNPYLWIKGIVKWCIRYDRTTDLYELKSAYFVLAAVSCLGSILLYHFIKRLLTRLLLAVSIVAVFVVFSLLTIPVGKAVVAIGIFYILCILIEISGILYSRKSGIKDSKESILYLLPACLLLAIISTGLPSKAEPIQWSGVKKVFYSVKDGIEKLITEWEFLTGEGDGIFSISLSGYSEEASLDNEDLNSSKKIALIVKGQKGLSPMYLIGSVNDTYTGYKWEKSKEEFILYEQEYQLDYAELIYALSRLDPQVIEENRLMEIMSVSIFYNNIKTKTFFYPIKSYWFGFNSIVNELNTEHAAITFPKAMGDKVSYSITYYEMNLQDESFQEILRHSDNFSYQDNNEINMEQIKILEDKLFVKDKDNFVLKREDFYDLFRERAKTINRRYTQVPENLPNRVKELAREITKDKNTNYDKLKAIELYLLEYSYSYTPGRVPENYDFVDYFLFENKKGYCTSFATSMAVLGRCIGIPTRYVEGFVVDYSDRTQGGFLVRNSNAHAWVEAYFEGVGWIPFEPTPGHHEIRYTRWPSKRREEKYDYTAYNIWLQEEPSMEEADEPSNKISADIDKVGEILVWILISVSVIFILLALVISYYLILAYKYRKKFEKSNYSMKIYMIFVRILMLLKYEGYTIRRQETILMLSEKVKDIYRYKDIKFGHVADIYMAYRYGEIPITELEFNTVDTFYKGLKEEHKSKINKLKQFLEEFFFLIKMNNINSIDEDLLF